MDEIKVLEGVQLVLARMKTNPEEFTGVGKWAWLTNAIWKNGEEIHPLTQEEHDLLKKGLVNVERELFNIKVFDTLMQEAPEQLDLPFDALPYATPFTASSRVAELKRLFEEHKKKGMTG